MIFNLIFNALLLVVFWLTGVIVLLLLIYRSELKKLWSEPMLRYPVVIFESDDWGVGFGDQVSALTDILQLFSLYFDHKKNHPVITLGVILAEPDVERMTLDKKIYYRRDLGDKRYHDLVCLMKKGRDERIFSLHLHGMEHFWPDSLMNVLDRPDICQWLFDSEERVTEDLPSFLQSRWCDTSVLPSSPLTKQKIAEAISLEISCFSQIFDQKPVAIVPPTFVWTEDVVKQYSVHDIHLFITPGKQYTGRETQGSLKSSNKTFYSGEVDQDKSMLYLVRDIYFEPKLGHKAPEVISEILTRTSLGRPSLIEMHRFNFLSDKKYSLNELKTLLNQIGEQIPQAMFLSAEQLANLYQEKRCFLYQSFVNRFEIWMKRVQLFFHYNRFAKYSGFNSLLNMILSA